MNFNVSKQTYLVVSFHLMWNKGNVYSKCSLWVATKTSSLKCLWDHKLKSRIIQIPLCEVFAQCIFGTVVQYLVNNMTTHSDSLQMVSDCLYIAQKLSQHTRNPLGRLKIYRYCPYPTTICYFHDWYKFVTNNQTSIKFFN